VVALVKLFLSPPKRFDGYDLYTMPTRDVPLSLDWLGALQREEHVTGDDVLELLEFVTEKGWVTHHQDWQGRWVPYPVTD
jgi:hypothetical protein